MQKINIDVSWLLRDWQKELFKMKERFAVIVAHRRSWKSFVTVMLLIIKSLETKGSYWYISPFYRQSKAIAWEILRKLASQVPWTVFNISELTATMVNWSTIRLFGADNPDSLRWLDLRGAIMDEYAQQPSNIYAEIIFPMINYHNWFVVFIWTPKGKNAFYKLYLKAKKDDKYKTILLKASESWLLTQQQLDSARQEMTQEEYDQEYECSFDASIKWAYYAKEIALVRKEERIVAWLYDPILPVYTFWDLWMSDYMAIVFVQIHWNKVRIIDVLQHNGEWFKYYSDNLREKGYTYKKHFFPADIAVRELTTGQSRLEIVRELFGDDKCEVVPKLWIMDWINALRKIFHNIYFDEEKTEELIEALVMYKQKYDEKRGIFLNQPEHDWTSHLADACRYLAVGYNELIVTPSIEWIMEQDYDDYLF